MDRVIRLAITYCLVSVFAGCSFEGFYTDYGPSKGYRARKSINGFAALRGAYVENGFSDRDIRRLTNRSKKVSTIVWTPPVISPISRNVTRWMDNWLRQGNRTLVYVVPDSGSESEYWKLARPLAKPEQRLEYRRRWAESLNRQQEWTLNRKGVQSNGWFHLTPKLQEAVAQDIVLRDSDTDDSTPNTFTKVDGPTDDSVRLEWIVEPYEKGKSPKKTGVGRGFITGQTSPSGSQFVPYYDVSVSSTKVDFTAATVNPEGEAIIAEITSDRWDDSKIIVVAAGSLLTNFAMTRDSNRRLVKSIVDESLRSSSSPTVGFCVAVGDMPISETARATPGRTGMELMTTYPLSLVTVHGALLGLIVILVLFPIFGRARRLNRGSLNDFGDHLDAVAALMKRNGGEEYARKQISDYMRRIHGETSGPWVLPDEKSSELLRAADSGNVAIPSTKKLASDQTNKDDLFDTEDFDFDNFENDQTDSKEKS